jgi:hypothetical protein
MFLANKDEEGKVGGQNHAGQLLKQSTVQCNTHIYMMYMYMFASVYTHWNFSIFYRYMCSIACVNLSQQLLLMRLSYDEHAY